MAEARFVHFKHNLCPRNAVDPRLCQPQVITYLLLGLRSPEGDFATDCASSAYCFAICVNGVTVMWCETCSASQAPVLRRRL